MSEKFFIDGGTPLKGTVEISGSKNAALPILAATLLCDGVSEVRNIPQIHDIRAFGEIMTALSVDISEEGNTWRINPGNLSLSGRKLSHPHIQKMRASILLLAPLLARFGEIHLPFPGGCVLGKRSVESHLTVFSSLGAEVREDSEGLHLSAANGLRPGKIILPERSVTATENALMATASISGESEIRMAAAEPHIQNLCHFLISAGAKISGIGTSTLSVQGTSLKAGTTEVTSDYLEAGTFLIAAAMTSGEVTVQNVEEDHLDSFFQKLREVGVRFEVHHEAKSVTVFSSEKELRPTSLQTGVFPAFPTDLHPQFAVLMTQCHGTSRIFETLFERKFAYLLELEKMGADVEILNPHQFLIHGPTPLEGTAVASQDIRAGAAILIAALAAKGTTEISNIHYIHRGYEHIEEKLQSLGAKIERRES